MIGPSPYSSSASSHGALIFKTTFAFLIALALGVSFGSLMVGCSSDATTGESEQSKASAEQTMSVDVSVDSSQAVNWGYPTSMGSGQVELKEGSTAYDALVALGVSVSGSGGYVTSINGLAEKACGPTSGWGYTVNSEFPTVGANEYVLADGDTVVWTYYAEASENGAATGEDTASGTGATGSGTSAS